MWAYVKKLKDLKRRDNLIFKTKLVNIIKLLFARFRNQSQITTAATNEMKDVAIVHSDLIDK